MNGLPVRRLAEEEGGERDAKEETRYVPDRYVDSSKPPEQDSALNVHPVSCAPDASSAHRSPPVRPASTSTTGTGTSTSIGTRTPPPPPEPCPGPGASYSLQFPAVHSFHPRTDAPTQQTAAAPAGWHRPPPRVFPPAPGSPALALLTTSSRATQLCPYTSRQEPTPPRVTRRTHARSLRWHWPSMRGRRSRGSLGAAPGLLDRPASSLRC